MTKFSVFYEFEVNRKNIESIMNDLGISKDSVIFARKIDILWRLMDEPETI